MPPAPPAPWHPVSLDRLLDAPHRRKRPGSQALLQVHGTVDFNRAGDRIGFGPAAIEVVVIGYRGFLIGLASVPA